MPISKLVHDRTGAGDPIVLLHGVGHRRAAWDPIVPLLANNYEVITVDLAGFGESPPYPKRTPYTMANAAIDLQANFAQWGITRPHIAGNSLGGAIALELGLAGHARSVTALSPAGFFGPVGRVQALGVLIPTWLFTKAPVPLLRSILKSPLLRRLAGMSLYVHPERFTAEHVLGDALSMRGSKGFLPTMMQAPGYSFSGQPPVSTTIAWGDHDRVLLPKQAAVAKERLPHAHHVPLTDCGHVPMIDDPQLVAQTILDTAARAQVRQSA